MKIELAQWNKLDSETIKLVCDKLEILPGQIYLAAQKSFWECCNLADRASNACDKIAAEGEEIPEYLLDGLAMLNGQKEIADQLIAKVGPLVPRVKYPPTKAGLKRLLSEGA